MEYETTRKIENRQISSTNIFNLLRDRIKCDYNRYSTLQILNICLRSTNENLLDKGYISNAKVFGFTNIRNKPCHLSSDGVSILRMGIDSLEAYKANPDKDNSYTIKGMQFPSGEFASLIFNSLDSYLKSQNLPKLSSDEIFDIAALCIIIISSAHGYIDANGRLSKHYAKLIIEVFTPYTIDIQKLESGQLN